MIAGAILLCAIALAIFQFLPNDALDINLVYGGF
jgi:hypothetical protein